MKPVYQIVFDDGLGDCFRACIASIFEFPIKNIPNFWEQTQDVDEFWQLINDWTVEHKGLRCLSVEFRKRDVHLTDGILCIAIGFRAPNNKVAHAVVWKDGLVHDPHPANTGLCNKPRDFALFIPLDPRC